MKVSSVWTAALVTVFVGVAISGEARPASAKRTSASTRAAGCGHYTAVCGGIYNSMLPNCSGGPDIYDLDVAAGVHFLAGPQAPDVGSTLDVQVTIVDPSGAEVATGLNAAEYTATASGLYKIVISSAGPTYYGLLVTCSQNPSCAPSPTVLCLNDDRFAVTTAWRTATGGGSGTGVKLTGDTGYFWFFDPDNVELVAKVLNGCALTDTYWVFAGGLTNVEVVLTVVDTKTGVASFYIRSAGPAFGPVQDTEALPTCP